MTEADPKQFCCSIAKDSCFFLRFLPSRLLVPRPPARAPRSQRRSASLLFNNLFLETLNERDHVALFGLGHLELRQGCGGMTEEHVPVAIADAHASVGEHHVPAAIVHRSARARAEEIDEELCRAASRRPWPAKTILVSSTSMGFRKPNFVMLAAICLVCLGECVRAFFGFRRSASIDTHSIRGNSVVSMPVVDSVEGFVRAIAISAIRS